ncbi:MAG: hypothetical protein ACREFU_02420 [Acetobacteraceae bacterium]
MANESAATIPGHPSPHRENVGLPLLLFGVFGGAAAFAVQLMLNFALASYSCYPRLAPRTALVPGWGGIWSWLLGINLGAIAIALIAAAIAWRNWHATRTEHPGGAAHLIEVGEGRTRFLGLVGVVFSLAFAIGVIFDLIALIIVPQCIG